MSDKAEKDYCAIPLVVEESRSKLHKYLNYCKSCENKLKRLNDDQQTKISFMQLQLEIQKLEELIRRAEMLTKTGKQDPTKEEKHL